MEKAEEQSKQSREKWPWVGEGWESTAQAYSSVSGPLASHNQEPDEEELVFILARLAGWKRVGNDRKGRTESV